MTDLIRYDLLVQDALRGVVRTVIANVAREGLPNDHHLYITFKTHAPGVQLSDAVRKQYPDEITIVLQHQFWDLTVDDVHFEVGLSFRNVPEKLSVPFTAISAFADPSVQFALRFEVEQDNIETNDGHGPGREQADGQSNAPAPFARNVPAGEADAGVAPKAAEPDSANNQDEASSGEAGNVVSIDAFRKKT